MQHALPPLLRAPPAGIRRVLAQCCSRKERVVSGRYDLWLMGDRMSWPLQSGVRVLRLGVRLGARYGSGLRPNTRAGTVVEAGAQLGVGLWGSGLAVRLGWDVHVTGSWTQARMRRTHGQLCVQVCAATSGAIRRTLNTQK